MQKHTRERVLPAVLFHLLVVSLIEYGHTEHGHTDPILFNAIGNVMRVKFNGSWIDGARRNLTNSRSGRGPRGCGMSSKGWTRVVGGQPADPKEWPWMVALIRRDSDQYCGGVLVTDRHVLTAAHCLYGVKIKNIIVRLGEYDFSKHYETRFLDFKVVDIKIHEHFNPSSYENDIALLKIHRPTIFNDYIWPICLPPQGMSFENKNAIVIGWGSQYYAGPQSSILMEVPVPVWPRDRCANTLAQRLPDTIMCAGAYEGGRDSCQGDSGGPLLHQLGNGRWVNIGIVSWGIRCGDPGHPGIYTRVNSFLDWIFGNAIF
ncbi:proclotting enzyme isoform X1 [Microplitis demolitor]|uniref:proclotting enzyme isoform X1 n=1 Tax=Microplitis demolitor TaxID=69319 RepID=UPI0004CCEB99|nr:proclotting enzyme isoform X1 [Microplitis demolitor]XP_008559037.1 proclotting enzyme isoform X1 [Microplitis demolitor]